MALRRDGKILGVRLHTDADHGAFFSDAQPSKFKIGLIHSAFAAYDIPAAHLTARGTYSNKAPGGVAYRCSFRVTEAMFFQERMVQAAADDLGMDEAEFRRMNFVRDEAFPHRTPFGFLTDSGQYAKCLDVGLKAIGYEDFRREQAEARKRGRLLGLGISTMTEPLGAGNSREYDILGIKMFDSAELKVHMTGKAIVRTGARGQGQGHETTWAQIVSHELGIPAEDVVVEEGDTDTAPFGMGTYASRSTPVAGAAVAMVARKIRAKARRLAAHLLEATEAYAMASMQFITFDAEGNCVGSNYMDYLLPTSWETPGFELHSEVVTPCPHHPIGAKGIGECAAVGGPAAFVNAVIDAISGTGVRNIDMPRWRDGVGGASPYRRDVSGVPPVRTDD